MFTFAGLSLTQLGLIGSLATTVLAIVGGWQAFRLGAQRRFRGLEERTKAVAFWTAWVAAQKSVTPERQMAKPLAVAREALDDLARFDDPEDGAEFVLMAPLEGLRWAFLLSRPKRPQTWPYQIIFYAFAAAGVIVIWKTAGELPQTPKLFPVFLAVIAVVVLVLVLLRWLVLAVDRRTPREGPKS